MKRRHLWMVAVSLIMAICMCFALSACDSCNGGDDAHTSHNWSTTYTADGATGHYQTCDGCDEKKSEAHVFDDETDATCDKCGYVRDLGSEPEHTHDYKWVDNGDGTHKEHCAVEGCDLPDKSEGAHDFSNGNCVCGAEDPDPDTHKHKYVYTDNGDGTHSAVCNGNGECTAPIKNVAHDFSNGDCVCGAENPNGETPEPGHTHDYKWVDNGDGTHKEHCAVEGCDLPDKSEGAHDFSNGNCVCGAKKPNDKPAPAENTVSFDFSEVSGDGVYDDETITAAFENACNDLSVFVAVTDHSNVYPNTVASEAGTPAIKLGVSKNTGAFTVTFERTVAKVVINCKAWSGDNAMLAVNGKANGTAQKVPAEPGDLEFELGANASNKITIAGSGNSSKNRCFIYSITVTFKVAQPLPAPENLAIDEYGVATWDAVEGAVKHAYRIGDGEVQYIGANEDCKVTLADGETIKVWAVGDGFDFVEDNEERSVSDTYTLTPVTLSMADVTDGDTVKEIVKINKSTGKVSWSAVKGAVKYVYTVKDNEGNVVDGQENVETTVPVTTITLGANHSITIKAIGDGTVYLDSAEVTKTRTVEPTTLDAPEVVILRDGTVKIKNTDAVSFGYSIDGGEAVSVENNHDDDGFVVLETKLTTGQSIAVTSIGNGNEISDSVTPTTISYVAPSTFTDVEVTIAHTGVNVSEVTVTWFAVSGATGYQYTVNNSALREVDAETATVDGQTQYTMTITLDEGDVFKLNVIGDENPANEPVVATGDYSTKYNTTLIEYEAFEIANSKTYSVADMLKIINYYGEVTATKAFTVTGVVTTNTDYSAYYDNIDITIRDENDTSANPATLILFRAVFASGVGSTSTKANELVGYVVTAEGAPVNYDSTKPELVTNGSITLTVTSAELTAAAKFDFAKADLAKKPAPTPTTTDNDYTYTLPVEGLYGTKITWSFTGLDEENDVYDETDGTLVITRRDDDATITATATITLGEGDDAISETLEALSFTVEKIGAVVVPPAVEGVVSTLTFTRSTMESVSAYDKTIKVTAGSLEFDVYGFNNNSNSWSYIKAGKKNTAYDATITTRSAIANKITFIEIEVDALTSGAVTSAKLIVDGDDSNPISFTVAKGTVKVAIPEGQQKENATYELVFSMKSTSSNGTMQISQIVYNGLIPA